jgi:hypothetical protein
MWSLLKLVTIALDIIAISDVLTKYKDLGTRLVLIVMILAVPIVGAGLYLVVFRPRD